MRRRRRYKVRRLEIKMLKNKVRIWRTLFTANQKQVKFWVRNMGFHLPQFQGAECCQNETKAKKRTSEKIADEYGVGRSTIIRNANFAKVVDILPEEVKHDVLSGEEKISRTMTDTILDFDKPTQKKFIKEKNV